MATDFLLGGETWTQPAHAVVSSLGVIGSGSGGGGNLGGGGAGGPYIEQGGFATSDGNTYFQPGIGFGGLGGDGAGTDGASGGDCTFTDDQSNFLEALGGTGGQDGINGGSGGVPGVADCNIGALSDNIGASGNSSGILGGGGGGGSATTNNSGMQGSDTTGGVNGDGSPSGGNGATAGSFDPGDNAYGTGGGGGGGDASNSGGNGGDGIGFVNYTIVVPILVAGTLSSTGHTTTTVSLSTTSSTGGSGSGKQYLLQRAPDVAGSPGSFTDVGSPQAGTTWVDVSLSASTKYWYRVEYFDSIASPVVGTPITVTTNSGTTPSNPQRNRNSLSNNSTRDRGRFI